MVKITHHPCLFFKTLMTSGFFVNAIASSVVRSFDGEWLSVLAMFGLFLSGSDCVRELFVRREFEEFHSRSLTPFVPRFDGDSDDASAGWTVAVRSTLVDIEQRVAEYEEWGFPRQG